MPTLTPADIDQLSKETAQYISERRNAYVPAALPLNQRQVDAMSGFFEPGLLRDTRLLVLENERVPHPGFYPWLKSLGFDNLPDQSTMAAITFSDTIVSHVPFSEGLLFHELIHVEQYRQLGIKRFADLYVRGFLSTGSYDSIPLERNAYLLGLMYEANPDARFSVRDEVGRWISESRF